jgi:NADPH-dependent 2,4-dienoyl-CoA reductase/sulfur reductase-like enzyme
LAVSSGEEGAIACAENPRTGHELDAMPLSGGEAGKRALVVGAGPGGMAAALMLDRAGYATELHEMRSNLGGGLIASAAPPFKDKLGWYKDYLERRLAASNVDVKLNSTIDSSHLARGADVVLIAAGARPVVLSIDGIDSPLVRDAYEVLMGDADWLPPPGSAPVVVYGGGETGCEAAEYVAERGCDVVLVTRSSRKDLARSAEMIYRGVLLRRLNENPRIRIVDHTHLVAVGVDEVTLRAADQAQSVLPTSRVLIAQGRLPDSSLADYLRSAGVNYRVIGDARRGGRIGDAVHDAYRAVMSECRADSEQSGDQLAC